MIRVPIQIDRYRKAEKLAQINPYKSSDWPFLPGNPTGFSWVRSRKPAFIPLAKLTVDSPNLSRKRSAADNAFCQRLRRSSSSKSPCWAWDSNEEVCTPNRRTYWFFRQFLRNSILICSKISVSSCVGAASECARVIVVKY